MVGFAKTISCCSIWRAAFRDRTERCSLSPSALSYIPVYGKARWGTQLRQWKDVGNLRTKAIPDLSCCVTKPIPSSQRDPEGAGDLARPSREYTQSGNSVIL